MTDSLSFLTRVFPFLRTNPFIQPFFSNLFFSLSAFKAAPWIYEAAVKAQETSTATIYVLLTIMSGLSFIIGTFLALLTLKFATKTIYLYLGQRKLAKEVPTVDKGKTDVV